MESAEGEALRSITMAPISYRSATVAPGPIPAARRARLWTSKPAAASRSVNEWEAEGGALAGDVTSAHPSKVPPAK
jgi:hypothetical protein